MKMIFQQEDRLKLNLLLETEFSISPRESSIIPKGLCVGVED